MKRSGFSFFAIALVIGLIFVGRGVGMADNAAFVCPPCGCKHDNHTFDKPGRCPSCGMELLKPNALNSVAVVLFEGVQIIDFTGPYEVFGQSSYQVFTVSESGEPLTTAMGLKVDPAYSIKDSPPADIVVVPGGHVHSATGSKPLIDWIKRQADKSKYVLSVCNGAFILAKAGLLDGKTATTFYLLLDELEKTASKTRIVRDQRFVDNGKVITTAGLSSGIDGALHVISKIEGPTKAKRVALHLEYDWRPEANYARAALADRHLPKFEPPKDGYIQTISTDGDRDRWTVVFRFHGAGGPPAVRTAINKQLRAAGWTAATKSTQAASWRFADRDGRAWTAQTTMTDVSDAVDLRIQTRRAGGKSASPAAQGGVR